MRIKELRVAAGLTQWQLAEQVGVSQPAVAMWETGVNIPNLANVMAMARALSCTIDELTRDPPGESVEEAC